MKKMNLSKLVSTMSVKQSNRRYKAVLEENKQKQTGRKKTRTNEATAAKKKYFSS